MLGASADGTITSCKSRLRSRDHARPSAARFGALLRTLWLVAICGLNAAEAASPAADLASEAVRAVEAYYVDLEATDLASLKTPLNAAVRAACAGDAGCEAQRAHAAIARFVEALPDPHSSFLTPAQAREARERQAASLAASRPFGLGAEIRGGPVVQRVVPGGPADLAGVRRGDVIRALLRGGAPLAGSAALTAAPVTLRLERAGSSLSLTATPTRGAEVALQLPQGETLGPDGRVAYLRLPSFVVAGTAQRAHDRLAELIEGGATSLVVDLRSNTGGLLDEALLTLGALGDGGQLKLRSRGGSETYRYSGGKLENAAGGKVVRTVSLARPTRFSGPVRVLVNASTAGAAEVFALAAGRFGARPIGELTRGLADAALLRVPLRDGSELRLAAVRNLFPDGEPLPIRVVPKVEVTDDPAAVARGKDPILDAALEELRRASGARPR